MDRLFETKSDDYYPEAGDLVCIDLNPILGHEQSGHRVRVFTSAQSQVTTAGQSARRGNFCCL
jgi:hypothetical protein